MFAISGIKTSWPTPDSFASVETLTASVQSTVKAQPFLALFLLAPLALVPRLVENLRMIVTGQSWLVDGSLESILKNGAQQARFADVAGIQIREFQHDKHPVYRLSIILKSGQKLAIHSSAAQSEIQAIADDIADLIGAPIATV